MITDFKALTIPEGEVVKIEDSNGVVLWEKASPLPYDAEIEYLEGKYYPKINTGIYANINSSFQIVMSIRELSSSAAGICGCRISNVNSSCIAGLDRTGFFVDFGSYRTNRLTYSSPATNTIYTIRNSKDERSVDNNVQTSTFSGTFSDTVEFSLFRIEGTSWSSAWMRLYSFKMWDGATLVRDMIPVRVGTTGYMYDKVSKQLFGNAGTGAFERGPDK